MTQCLVELGSLDKTEVLLTWSGTVAVQLLPGIVGRSVNSKPSCRVCQQTLSVIMAQSVESRFSYRLPSHQLTISFLSAKRLSY